jgi:hypothetical protein
MTLEPAKKVYFRLTGVLIVIWSGISMFFPSVLNSRGMHIFDCIVATATILMFAVSGTNYRGITSLLLLFDDTGGEIKREQRRLLLGYAVDSIGFLLGVLEIYQFKRYGFEPFITIMFVTAILIGIIGIFITITAGIALHRLKQQNSQPSDSSPHI